VDIKIFAIKFITILGDLVTYAIFARILLSWFMMGRMSSPGRIAYFIKDITDPILNLAKKLPHKIGFIDLSPVIALIVINFVVYLLVKFIVYI
jgi:YggT family protein